MKELDLAKMVVLTNRIPGIGREWAVPTNVWINIVRSIVDILERRKKRIFRLIDLHSEQQIAFDTLLLRLLFTCSCDQKKMKRTFSFDLPEETCSGK